MLFISWLLIRKFVSLIEKFNGSLFLIIKLFDGLFLIRAFLIERDWVKQQKFDLLLFVIC